MSVVKATAELYDKNGTTLLGALTLAEGIHWQDVQNGRGAGGLSFPLSEALASSIGENSIVKCSVFGQTPFAFVVKRRTIQLAADGIRWVKLDNEPGLLSLLDEADVRPEYGLSRISGATRTFGYMSIDNGWLVSADWVTPGGVSYATDTARPLPAPPSIFASNNPSWIAIAPDTTVPAGTVQYFRSVLTLASAAQPTAIFTADNFFDLYIDGEIVVTSEQSKSQSWTQAYTAPLTLDAGTHVIAARVENAWHASGANPMALMGLITDVDHAGQPTGTPYLKTDTTHWLVNAGTNPPGWRRAAVLIQLFNEAVTAGDRGPSLLSLGFTATHDSNGVAWDDAPSTYSFQVGQSLADVAMTLCESYMDIWVDPATMTLHAYKRRGGDLSGSVKLEVGSPAGGGLQSFETTREYARRTVLLTQLANGRWVETVDTAGVAASGRICATASLGNVTDVATATGISQAILTSSANPPVTITSAETSVLTGGAIPYLHFSNGDTVEGPNEDGTGTLKYRSMEITFDGTTEPPRLYPSSLVEDRSV